MMEELIYLVADIHGTGAQEGHAHKCTQDHIWPIGERASFFSGRDRHNQLTSDDSENDERHGTSDSEDGNILSRNMNFCFVEASILLNHVGFNSGDCGVDGFEPHLITGGMGL